MHPDSGGARGGPRIGIGGSTPGWDRILPGWHYSAPLAFAFLIHFSLIMANFGHFAAGGLIGPDSYVRMIRVMDLIQGAQWFDQPFPPEGAPFSHTLHWTRPLDGILLALAAMLAPFLGIARALHWAGVVVSPLLHLGIVAALVWALAPVFDRGRRALAGFLVSTQMVTLLYVMAGRADHHALILLLFTLLFGTALRIMNKGECLRRNCVIAGMLTGFGLWISVEFLATTVLVYAALTVRWWFDGTELSRRGLALSLGLIAMTTVAVLAEQSPEKLLEPVFERISIVHWTLAAMAVILFAIISHIDRSRIGGRQGLRFVTTAVIGSIFAGSFWMLFPEFLNNPMTAHPGFEAFMSNISGLNPIFDIHAPRFGRLLIYEGGALIAVTFSLWLLITKSEAREEPFWPMTTLLLLVFGILAAMQIRWGLYVGVAAAPALAELTWRIAVKLGAGGARLRFLTAYGMVALSFGIGPIAAGQAISTMETTAKPRMPQANCLIPNISRYLSDPATYGRKPNTILTRINYGPEIMYRTPHRVVATLHHHDLELAGIAALYRIMKAVDMDQARRWLQHSGVGLILICPTGKHPYGTGAGNGLYERLVSGRLPPWLEAVNLPASVDDGFRLFELH